MTMTLDELKYLMFDVINETPFLPIQDIYIDDTDDLINVYLENGIRFSVRIENYGNWLLYETNKAK